MTRPITRVALTDQAELLAPEGERRMDLPGFDAEFVDFPDYIIRITDRIWHQRQVELCERYYTADCLIHTLAGDVIGAKTVTDNTRRMMEAFPDRRLEPDNVIWSKEEGDAGFYSSHLITSPMTNTGPSEFGPATNRPVRLLTIADCLCRDNKIYREWLVRDTKGLVQQLGFDVEEVARQQAEVDLENGQSLIAFHADRRAHILAQPKPEHDAQQMLDAVWQAQPDLGAYYLDRCRGLYPGSLDLYGTPDIQAVVSAVMAAVPDLTVRAEHVCAVPYLEGGRDIAVRIGMAGTHTQDGFYGPATGAPITIMAACHWRVIHGRIHAEWMVWDDLAVRRQIWAARLSA